MVSKVDIRDLQGSLRDLSGFTRGPKPLNPEPLNPFRVEAQKTLRPETPTYNLVEPSEKALKDSLREALKTNHCNTPKPLKPSAPKPYTPNPKPKSSPKPYTPKPQTHNPSLRNFRKEKHTTQRRLTVRSPAS